MVFTSAPSDVAHSSLADVKHAVYWLDRDIRPEPRPRLRGIVEADLAVIGGGFTGLWAAIEAKRQDPDASVVLLEGARIGSGGSGRNGGFLAASLTHGLRNGHDRWPEELPELLRMGMTNVQAIEDFLAEFAIEADFQRTGELQVAVEPHQVAELHETVALAQRYGVDLEFLDQQAVRARVDSPTYLGAVYDRTGVAVMDPAALAWGLAAAAEALGVIMYERTPVEMLSDHGAHVFITARSGGVRARRVALGTNAYPPLLKRIRHYVVPVYDYVLMTEPLSNEQWQSIGWQRGEGLADSGNQFHYYRRTADGRILWGGYDAIYHPGNAFGPQYERDDASYLRLAQHFFETFPQLAGVRFSHAWGGAIDTCSRFAPFWGTAHGGKTGYVVGYTGLGTGSSRFGAMTMLDLIHGRRTERTELQMVRTKPLPFPPEPARTVGIRLTTASLAEADRNGGRRNLWLRLLDSLGLGFDS